MTEVISNEHQQPLNLAMWMNEHSDFWYRYIYGDKDTFYFAWRKCGEKYEMPTHGPQPIHGIIMQYDLDGCLLFQHRHAFKWQVDADNRSLKGFLHDDICQSVVAKLRTKWASRPPAWFCQWLAGPGTKAAAEVLCNTKWLFEGSDGPRSMAFTPDGLIRRGARWSEVTWNMRMCDDGPLLVLNGQNRVSMNLRRNEEGNWARVSEETEIVLRPIVPQGRFGVTLQTNVNEKTPGIT